MIGLNAFKKRMEDSVAPNDCDFGRPSIAEICERMQELEKRPDVAWIRIELHNDTEIAEHYGKEVSVLAGESPRVCTSLLAPELEMLAGCEWLHSGGAEEWDVSSADSLFSGRPPVPDGFHCFAIVWD